MKKEHAINVLNRIRSIQDTKSKLRELGVDLIDYQDGVNLLEKSVAILFAQDEQQFGVVLDDIQWWLYEEVEKVITLNGKRIDVTSPEAFVNWIEEFCASKD
jgi:hypothetical protein